MTPADSDTPARDFARGVADVLERIAAVQPVEIDGIVHDLEDYAEFDGSELPRMNFEAGITTNTSGDLTTVRIPMSDGSRMDLLISYNPTTSTT